MGDIFYQGIKGILRPFEAQESVIPTSDPQLKIVHHGMIRKEVEPKRVLPGVVLTPASDLLPTQRGRRKYA